jgi:hypothetical protein
MWQLFAYPGENFHGYQLIKAPKKGTQYMEYWPSPEDATFIAHSRTDVPALLDENQRLRLALGALVSAMNGLSIARAAQPTADLLPLARALSAALLAAEHALGLIPPPPRKES